MSETIETKGEQMVTAGKVKILIVDDNQLNLSALRAALNDMSVEIVSAKSGEEALKYLLAEDFALVLLDVQMPGIDGFETARLIRLRDKTKHIPIIFITAMYREEAEAFKGYSLGAVDYIIKPFSKDILKSKVAVFVNLYEVREQVKHQAEVILAHEKREHEAMMAEAKRRMEEETYRVKEEHRITQMILKNAPVGIVHVGNDYSIREVNAAIADHFGLKINDLLHKNIFEALPWLPREPFRNALERGERYFEREFSVGDPNEDLDSSPSLQGNGNNLKNENGDGVDDAQFDEQLAFASDSKNNMAQKSGHFDIAIWPVESENHTIIGAVLVAVDVAERVRLARQREDFVATLTHDLQTPVIATDRAIELLLNSAGKHLEESHLMLVKKLRANNSNLLHMIQQLLDVYRYEAGAQVHYFDSVNLGLTVESCVDSLSAIIKEHDLTLETDLPTNLKKIWADHPAIRRVLINLLENAIKYTPRHSKITIGARNLPTCVLLSISNPGSGIQQEDIPLLFQRYWHKSQEKTYKPSSGLGLYLCKQIVEAHGGEIWCESEQNQMTTFYVKLPFLKLEGKDKRHIKGKVANAN